MEDSSHVYHLTCVLELSSTAANIHQRTEITYRFFVRLRRGLHLIRQGKQLDETREMARLRLHSQRGRVHRWPCCNGPMKAGSGGTNTSCHEPGLHAMLADLLPYVRATALREIKRPYYKKLVIPYATHPPFVIKAGKQVGIGKQ